MITIDPKTVIGPEGLLEHLLEGVEFSAFPVEMIGAALLRCRYMLTAMQSGMMDDQDYPHMADAAQSQVESALALVLAWDRQQRMQPS